MLAAVDAQVAELMRTEPDLELAIRPVGPGRLELVLADASAQSRRELAFTASDCPALPRMVAMLLHGWIERRWKAPPSSEPPIEAAPPPPPPEPSRKPVLAGIVDAPPPTPAGPARARVAVLGGGFAAGAAQSSAAARASVEAMLLPRFGIALRLAYDASPDLPVARGRFFAPLYGLGAMAQWLAAWSPDAALNVFGGPEVVVLAVSSQGFARDLSPKIPNLAFVTGAQLHYRISGALEAVAGAELAVRAWQEQLRLRDTTEEISISTTRVTLLAGLSWRVD